MRQWLNVSYELCWMYPMTTQYVDFFNIMFNEEKFSLNHPNFFVYSHDFEYSVYFCLYEK